jgi:phage-related minor tail protein
VKKLYFIRSVSSATALIFALLIISGCSSVKSVTGLFGGGSDRSGSSGGSSSGSGAERNYSGESETVPWPSDADWGRYGLAGLQQPAGTSVTVAALYQGAYRVGLINGGKSALEALVRQIEKMPGAELVTDVNSGNGKMVGYSLTSCSIEIVADYENGDTLITAIKK